LAKIGGWLNIKASEYFLRYVKYVAEALSDKVNYWITINEPLVYIYHSYILGIWPPQEKSFLKAKKVRDNFILTHIKTHQLIHDIYQRKSLPHPKISIAQNLHAFIPCSPTLKNKLAVYLRDKFFNLDFLHKLVRHKSLDFIGVNYYTRNLVDVEKWGFKNLVFDVCRKNHHPLKKNSLGWDIYPEGLYNILLRLKKYNLPIMITENGICTQDDNERWNFINAHLKNIHRTMEAGVKVLGYIYWSLMDNFEWEKGFTPRFGLIDIDYQTYERTIRESAKKFASVCRTGKLD
jgi:beta-glucosidase